MADFTSSIWSWFVAGATVLSIIYLFYTLF